MMSESSDEDQSDFDQQLADSYVGKYVLAQLRVHSNSDEFLEVTLMHGIIISAKPGGIEIQLKGKRAGEVYVLAPILDAFESAEPGFYVLEDGDTVDSPDLICRFKVTRPPQDQ